MNPMRNIKIEKLTLNIGTGKDQAKLEKGMKLIKNIASIAPVKTITKKRIPNWGIRPGLPVGCKLTLRKDKALALIPKLLAARDNKLEPAQFDENGSIAFGIPEYIDIPETKYDPEIGMMGLEICITLERKGFRIKKRKIKKQKISKRHAISKQEAMDFIKNKFKIEIGESE
ncbi:50S ribosomal protein L5 [Candidatus Woesearchaeota archaeon]|nr:50S ribosomal protein L5 [Candidatus Woesearchaeota archaeon]